MSNVQIRAVHSLAAHPADGFLTSGLVVTISTDARTTSATTLSREFAELHSQFGWSAEQERRCQDHAAMARFG